MARKNKNVGKVNRPLIDQLADANVQEKVRAIMAEKPDTQTLSDKVKDVLAK